MKKITALLAFFSFFVLLCCQCWAADIQVKTKKVTGIGYEAGLCRRDPSDVIKVGNKYYVWYSRLAKGAPIYPEGYAATVWYAVSEDAGHLWIEKGESLPKGKPGEFDSTSVFTPNILPWKGKYYLYYTAVGDGFTNRGYSDKERTAFGLAISDSPDGPWTKLPKPILESTRDPKFFDSFRVDDAGLRVVDGKIWFYYKGRPWQGPGGVIKGIKTPMHLAMGDRPEGPYQRMNGGMPVQTGGHELQIWEEDGGVYSMVANLAPNANTLRFSPNGMEFDARVIANFKPYAPIAPGLYRPELTGEKVTSRQRWGIAMNGWSAGDPYLIRYEFTMPDLIPEVAGNKSTTGSSPTHLECEIDPEPLALDVAAPRLTWLADKAVSCQVLVASTAELLKDGKGDLWDSGELPCAGKAGVQYQGKPLTPGMNGYWKVRVKPATGTFSEWSATAHWRVAATKKAEPAATTAKKRVLTLGDSTSMRYAPILSKIFPEVQIVRPGGNHCGTKNALKQLDYWLGDGKWDVIHFNFGLHDAKRIVPGSEKSSDNPKDPLEVKPSINPQDPIWVSPEQYRENITQIVKRLKQTGAKLIFATTTPVPEDEHYRVAIQRLPPVYNQIAIEVMKENGVAVNDVYSYVLPHLKSWQQPKDVHFNATGSRKIAEKIKEAIQESLK